jgi:hypothetical protein
MILSTGGVDKSLTKSKKCEAKAAIFHLTPLRAKGDFAFHPRSCSFGCRRAAVGGGFRRRSLL